MNQFWPKVRSRPDPARLLQLLHGSIQVVQHLLGTAQVQQQGRTCRIH